MSSFCFVSFRLVCFRFVWCLVFARGHHTTCEGLAVGLWQEQETRPRVEAETTGHDQLVQAATDVFLAVLLDHRDPVEGGYHIFPTHVHEAIKYHSEEGEGGRGEIVVWFMSSALHKLRARNWKKI